MVGFLLPLVVVVVRVFVELNFPTAQAMMAEDNWKHDIGCRLCNLLRLQ